MARTQRKVPAGPKAQPKKPSGKSASSTKQPKAKGIDPGNPQWGIQDTSRKHKSAVTGGGRNTPSGQARLSSKAKRQVG